MVRYTHSNMIPKYMVLYITILILANVRGHTCDANEFVSACVRVSLGIFCNLLLTHAGVQFGAANACDTCNLSWEERQLTMDERGAAQYPQACPKSEAKAQAAGRMNAVSLPCKLRVPLASPSQRRGVCVVASRKDVCGLRPITCTGQPEAVSSAVCEFESLEGAVQTTIEIIQ
jgi:hypothetical protein